MAQIVTAPDGSVHEFPDAATPEQMKAALASYVTAKPDTASAPAGMRPRPTALQTYGGSFLRGVPAALGLAGSMVGSVGGPMGRSALAGLGGMTGRGIEGLGRRAIGLPETNDPVEALRQMLDEGAMQASLQGTGELAAGAASNVGKGLVREAYKVAPSLAKKFPGVNIVETAIKEKVPVDVAKAAGKRAEAAAATSGALSRATARGITHSIEDIAAPALEQAEREIGRPLAQAERDQIVKMVQDQADLMMGRQSFGVGTRSRTTYTPKELKRLAQIAQRETRTLTNQRNAGNLTANPDLVDAIARGATAAKNALPGVGAAEGRTQSLIAVEQAAKNAAARGPMGSVPFLPPAVNWMIPHGLMDRGLASNLGIALNDPRLLQTLLQAPRGASLLAQLALSNQPQP